MVTPLFEEKPSVMQAVVPYDKERASPKEKPVHDMFNSSDHMSDSVENVHSAATPAMNQEYTFPAKGDSYSHVPAQART